MNNGKIKVLYIAGWGRSGSTILDSILGQIDGFFSGGELCFIWNRSLIENRLCGCGVPFRQCEVWREVLNKAFGGIDKIDAQEMLRLGGNARTRYLLLTLIPQGRDLLVSRFGKYLDNLERLYQAIQCVTGSRVIIDSSKFPSYGYVLGIIPTIDLHVVHLIRDSRAVAYSWQRSKSLPDTVSPVYMDRYNPVQSSLLWNTMAIATEVFLRHLPRCYTRLRYEDFVDKPQESIEHILNLVEEEAPHLPFVTEREVKMGINHTASGNPVRFRTGTVELRLDKEWETRMEKADKVIVTALTWPLLLQYGYLGRNR